MKVAIIINTSWNIYNFRKGLVQSLLDRGDEVIAIAPRDAYSEHIVDWGCEFIHIEMDGTGMNPLKDIGLLFSIKKKLRECRADIVLSYTIKPNLYASVASGLIGIPCICNVSGLGTVFLWTGALKKFAVFLYSFCFRFNKWTFFQNDEDREEFLSLIHLDKEKTSLLPGSGINTQVFSFTPNPPTEKTTFLMISRLIVEKGVREYIEAIRILKQRTTKTNLQFKLIGGLDENHARTIQRKELDEWIEEGLIEHTEHLSDVRPEIQMAHVIVLPSYREGTPRTLLEGGAMGRALLASDVAGCRHVLKDGYNGFLFEVRNPVDMANKMDLYLAMNDEERKVMSKNSRARIEELFDEKKVIELYTSKIDDLVAKKLIQS
ncbi:MAG: glycosyltransferase family 4 protein [Cyclobacteriaceae bacterium]